ncbi:hypothetical protein AB1Y20_000425 [Prymnesium parvum]|uniref:RNA 3'-terminal-phosphate cyclase (ATP) n=1 Tax=Prymnesium parvum TaxID=97485 RepID=A0AB34KAE2_PRYPA
MLRYKGAQQFRQRIVLATLSGRPVRIDGIRESHEQVGLRDYEACFLRLLEKLVNGCDIVINETGTAIRYRPGIITGGAGLSHDCGTSRAISYFVQPLLLLAPFAKAAVSITLKGITNSADDVGVDVLRTVTVPMLRHFGISEGASLLIQKRGAPPLGGGEVVLTLPTVRELGPVQLTESAKVKRVRGVAYSAKVSPQVANRLVDATRAVMNRFLPDVWVYTDIHKGKTSGLSPGFGLTLVAETTNGALLSAEVVGAGGVLPEDVGASAADALIEQIKEGGVVDSANQPTALVLMALGPEDVSRIRLGPLTPFTVETLRLIHDFFGIAFQIEPSSDDSLVLSCRGVGFRNTSKRVT